MTVLGMLEKTRWVYNYHWVKMRGDVRLQVS